MSNDFSNMASYDDYSLETIRSPSLYQMPQNAQEVLGVNFTHVNHSPSMNRRRSPESLIPIDAPTQPRTYATPSSTSRKQIPAFFDKRRSLSQHSEEEEDELFEEPPAANATDQQKIEYKRRQNTLAARRSRKRKMTHQVQLEEAVVRLTREKEIWRTRALTLKQLLVSHGIPCPDFKD